MTQPVRNFSRIAAQGLCLAVGFAFFGLLARVLFPSDPEILTVFLIVGNLVGWIAFRLLYERFDPDIWLSAFRILKDCGIILMFLGAGELWGEYADTHNPTSLLWMSLAVATGTSLLRVTMRSYFVTIVCLGLSVVDLHVFMNTGRPIALIVMGLCLALGAVALIPRPALWRVSQ